LKWDSGRREAPWFAREAARLEDNLQRLQRLHARLSRRYRTHWPKHVVERFRTEHEEPLRAAFESLEREQWQPWFPDSIIAEIRQELGLPVNGELLEQLFRAVSRLKDARARSAHGRPHLTNRQREQLARIQDAMYRFLKACGPNVEATQRLIGGWADGRLPGGQALTGVVKSMSGLSAEVSMRLHRARPRAPRRPEDVAFKEFCADGRSDRSPGGHAR
jgi:hypothetical protein